MSVTKYKVAFVLTNHTLSEPFPCLINTEMKGSHDKVIMLTKSLSLCYMGPAKSWFNFMLCVFWRQECNISGKSKHCGQTMIKVMLYLKLTFSLCLWYLFAHMQALELWCSWIFLCGYHLKHVATLLNLYLP